jgi:ubiquitin-like protein Pup
MSDQVQKKPESAVRAADEVAKLPEHDQEKRDKQLAEIDDILADIDGILEEDAQEFVASFQQKGGE